MKKAIVTTVIALAVIVVIGIASALWLFRFRPLTVYAWTTRAALKQSGMQKVTVDSPAGPQVVWTGGSGPVVVLLHGAGDQAGTWYQVVPRLMKTHKVIVPDLAGHGDSAPRSGPIETNQIYDGVVAALDRFAPKENVTIVGNSLGGWMAMVVAHRRPQRIEKIVCVDGGAMKGSNEHARVLPQNREEARQSVAQTRDAKSQPIPDYLLDDIVRQAKSGSLARFASTASTMGPFILDENALREINVPVRLVWGASDKLMPLDYAQRMSSSLRDTKLEVIEGCGHVPQVECPDRFLKALEKALGE